MLDLRRVRVFQEVARVGSFSAAADALDYSQPAISHHISRLELEVGTRLLVRRSRGGVSLTPAGRVLLPHAEAILDRVNDAETELAQVVHDEASCVRIGAFTSASATIVATAAGQIRRADPSISLTLLEGETPDTLERLQQRKIDIGVVFDDPAHPIVADDDVEIRYVYDDPLLIALPLTHQLAGEQAVQLADLRDAHWIEGAGRETPCSRILDDAFEEAGYQPRIVFDSGDYQVVLRLVAAGVGVGVVPRLAVSGYHPDVVLLPLRPRPLYRRIALVSRARGYRSSGLLVMLDALEQVGRELADAVSDAQPGISTSD